MEREWGKQFSFGNNYGVSVSMLQDWTTFGFRVEIRRLFSGWGFNVRCLFWDLYVMTGPYWGDGEVWTDDDVEGVDPQPARFNDAD